MFRGFLLPAQGPNQAIDVKYGDPGQRIITAPGLLPRSSPFRAFISAQAGSKLIPSHSAHYAFHASALVRIGHFGTMFDSP
jgi:hypothetical protein